ncbi:MAG: RNA-guided pseudouridylation complex pseudouridine synthase subunit Cbf5 [Candidatus Micrarchaeota archaeon]
MLILSKQNGALGKAIADRTMEEHLMYGIAIIDKPPGPSSHEVSAFVRKILGLSVTGHTGTLDQNVSGVLVVLLENSRKISGYAARADKKYVCLMKLGREVPKDALEDAFSNLRGEIYQKPPLLSAVAKKLRVRKVHALNILEIRGKLILFECECEAGTYIRKIVFDCGELLGEKADMVELRRTRAGSFSEKQAISLQALTDYAYAWREMGEESYLRKAILPLESLPMAKIILTDEAARKIRTGIRPKITDVCALDENIEPGIVAGAYTLNGELIAACKTLLSADEIKRKHGGELGAEPIAAIERVIHEF